MYLHLNLSRIPQGRHTLYNRYDHGHTTFRSGWAAQFLQKTIKMIFVRPLPLCICTMYHAFLRVNLCINLRVQCDMYTIMLMSTVDYSALQDSAVRARSHVQYCRSRGQHQTVSKYPELRIITPSFQKNSGGPSPDTPERPAPSGLPKSLQPYHGSATESHHFY